PGAGVADGDFGVTVLVQRGAYGQLLAAWHVRHGIHAVEEEIQEYLLQLNSVSSNEGEIRGELRLDRDAATAGFRADQPKDFRDHLVEIDWLHLAVAFAQQRSEAANHFARPQIVPADVVQDLVYLVERHGRALEQDFGGVRVAQDGAQGLV